MTCPCCTQKTTPNGRFLLIDVPTDTLLGRYETRAEAEKDRREANIAGDLVVLDHARASKEALRRLNLAPFVG